MSVGAATLVAAKLVHGPVTGSLAFLAEAVGSARTWWRHCFALGGARRPRRVPPTPLNRDARAAAVIEVQHASTANLAVPAA